MMYRRLLVADDGSEPGAAALNEAINLAKSDGGELRIVYVTQRPFPYGPAIIDPAAAKGALREEGHQVLERAARRADKAGVTAKTQLIDAGSEPIAKAIVQEAQAWGADLIVMGTHGRRGIEHLMLGSVAEALLRVATRPVLMVRTVAP